MENLSHRSPAKITRGEHAYHNVVIPHAEIAMNFQGIAGQTGKRERNLVLIIPVGCSHCASHAKV
jgi:hypothetical protein